MSLGLGVTMATKTRAAVYLDSCCFIDAVKASVGNLPSGRVDDVWHIKKLLEAHKAGEIVVVTSTLSIGECVAVEPGQAVVPANVQEIFRRLLTSGQFLVLQPQTPRTGQIVQDLRWKHNLVLKGQDALHIAAALEYGVREFVSTDDQLRKPRMILAAQKLANSGIRFIRAASTTSLPEHYRQGEMLNA